MLPFPKNYIFYSKVNQLTAFLAVSTLATLVTHSPSAQSVIGSTVIDAAVKLKIDNQSNAVAEALQVTGLPAGDLGTDEIMTIDPAGNVGRVAASTMSSEKNLATDDLTQDAEKRIYNMNGQDLEFSGGQTLSVGSSVSDPAVTVTPDLALHDANSDGNAVLQVQSVTGSGVTMRHNANGIGSLVLGATDFSNFAYIDSRPSGFSQLSTSSGSGGSRATLSSAERAIGPVASLSLHNNVDTTESFEMLLSEFEHRIRSQLNGSTTTMNFSGGDVILSGNLSQNSDKRLKTDIQTLEDSLSKLSGIRAVRYNWIDTENRPTDDQIGVIAQEVQAVLPELVNTDADGTLSVSYANLAAVAVQAINELKAQQDALKIQVEKNAELHRTIANLHADANRVTVLEAKLETLSRKVALGSSIIEAKLAD